jgi:hypothetical protein
MPELSSFFANILTSHSRDRFLKHFIVHNKARGNLVVEAHTTSWKVVGSIPDDVIIFLFNLLVPNPSSRTKLWGLLRL